MKRFPHVQPHFNLRIGKPEVENLAGQALYCLTALRELEKQRNILQRPSTNAPEFEPTAYRQFRRKIAQVEFWGDMLFTFQLLHV